MGLRYCAEFLLGLGGLDVLRRVLALTWMGLMYCAEFLLGLRGLDVLRFGARPCRRRIVRTMHDIVRFER